MLAIINPDEIIEPFGEPTRFESRLVTVLRGANRLPPSRLAWPGLIVADIAAVSEFAEEANDQWIPERPKRRARDNGGKVKRGIGV